MATATPLHPSHALARLKFAQDMANALWAALTIKGRRDSHLADHLAGFSEDARLVLAKHAGRDRVPSDGTWTEFCALIRQRVAAERGEG